MSRCLYGQRTDWWRRLRVLGNKFPIPDDSRSASNDTHSLAMHTLDYNCLWTWSEGGKRGRMFIYFVGLILASYVRSVWQKDDVLRKKFSSTEAVLAEMRTIRCIKHTGKMKVITPFVGSQVDICKAFGFASWEQMVMQYLKLPRKRIHIIWRWFESCKALDLLSSPQRSFVNSKQPSRHRHHLILVQLRRVVHTFGCYQFSAELILYESPDDSYFPKSGGSTFLKTVGSHFSEICGNKVTAYSLAISPLSSWRWVAMLRNTKRVF